MTDDSDQLERLDADLDRIQVLLDAPAPSTTEPLAERIERLTAAQTALDGHVRQIGEQVERLAARLDATTDSAVALLSSTPKWSAMADAMGRLTELTSIQVANARRSNGLLRWSLALSLAVNLLLAAACFGPSGPWALAGLFDQLPTMASLAATPAGGPPPTRY